ncbi:peptide/nickel transport system substrate-binding protein [Nocardia transvalensis]|uniref:Peptide/nickel transport system substrate-binding protein n=1 Tax=Nocardia transvalensis TaxID=37333 RepID=A0A7W9PI37_9NOCA|nr:ABC transporter substrate-binding protein [Nocardia transvalensis]MBB5916093.1 peptide/nickel transport system substrate-binding protein [Nocardia transvalensis]
MAHDMSRRRALTLGGALLGAGLAAACGTSNAVRGSAPAGSAPAPGGEITYLAEKLIDGYQQQSTGSWHVAQVWNQIVERLFYYDAAGKFHPHLATGFTQNDERTEFGLTIRQGVTFSNGERLDAEAVAANLNLLGKGDKKRGIPRAAYIPTTFDKAEAVGEYEVRIRLTAPFADFIQKLGAWTTVGILAPATVAGSLADQSDLSKIFGTGPFVVESWSPSREVVLRRRADYAWPRGDTAHRGPAYLERVTVKQVIEPSLRIGSLQAGQVDVIHYVQPTEEPFVTDGLRLIAPAFFGSVWGLQLRLTAPHMDDVRVRRALTHGIDRREILATNYPSGAWTEAKSTFNDVVPGTLDLRERFAYDPDRANSLLDEAGWTGRDRDGYRTKDGARLSFLIYPSVFITTSKADLQLIAQQWRKIGVRLEITGTDFSNYNTVTAHPDVPLYENHWLAGSQTEMWRWWHSSQGNQFMAPGAELDGLLEALAQAKSENDRIGASKAVQEYVIDNAYYIPVHEFRETWGAADRLRDLGVDGLGLISFYDAWLDS